MSSRYPYPRVLHYVGGFGRWQAWKVVILWVIMMTIGAYKESGCCLDIRPEVELVRGSLLKGN